MAKDVIHISEAEAASDFALVMSRVREGAEVIIERDAKPVDRHGIVQTNKSDYIDAEAIAEAVGRPRMRFVPIKTEEQLDLQALHRVRERWVMRRTAVVNQTRSLLLERGLTLRKGRSHLEQRLPEILEDAELNLSGSFRVLLAQLQVELEQLRARAEQMDARACSYSLVDLLQRKGEPSLSASVRARTISRCGAAERSSGQNRAADK